MSGVNFNPLGFTEPFDMHINLHGAEDDYHETERKATEAANRILDRLIEQDRIDAHKQNYEETGQRPGLRQLIEENYEQFKLKSAREEQLELQAKLTGINEHKREGTITLSGERIHGDKG